MKITVRTKPHARKNEVVQTGENSYTVSVTAPAVDDKANKMLISVIAEYFKKPRRCVSILRGASSRIKIVTID
jgi:uncharacterized protein (TIGR00251 family)